MAFQLVRDSVTGLYNQVEISPDKETSKQPENEQPQPVLPKMIKKAK